MSYAGPWKRFIQITMHISLPEVIFRVNNTLKILHNLNKNKSSDGGGIAAIALINCAPESAPIFTRLFLIFHNRVKFPDYFKTARVKPISKKLYFKSRFSRSRPIPILPILSNGMNKDINFSILNSINDRQYAF